MASDLTEQGAQPGHVAYLTKSAMSEIAERAQLALDAAIVAAIEAQQEAA